MCTLPSPDISPRKELAHKTFSVCFKKRVLSDRVPRPDSGRLVLPLVGMNMKGAVLGNDLLKACITFLERL
jgi:hypothetical protein